MEATAPGLPAQLPAAQRLRRLFAADDYAGFQALLAATVADLADPAGFAAAHLGFLLRFSERACLDLPVIDALLGRLAARARDDAALSPVWQAVARRQRFRRQLRQGMTGALSMVSLGLHCLPWTLVNRWGFRDSAQFSALYNPFCLALHKVGTVIDAIAGNFAGYAEPAALRQATAPRGRVIAMRRDGGAVWNHHGGPAWLEDDYAGLRATMRDKAEAFRASCHAPGLVFLMGDCRIEDPTAPIAWLPALRAALYHCSGQPRPRLILTSQPRRGGSPGLAWLDAETALLAAPYPHPHYVWADDDNADSDQGLDWEQGCASGLQVCLHRWGIAGPVEQAA